MYYVTLPSCASMHKIKTFMYNWVDILHWIIERQCLLNLILSQYFTEYVSLQYYIYYVVKLRHCVRTMWHAKLQLLVKKSWSVVCWWFCYIWHAMPHTCTHTHTHTHTHITPTIHCNHIMWGSNHNSYVEILFLPWAEPSLMSNRALIGRRLPDPSKSWIQTVTVPSPSLTS